MKNQRRILAQSTVYLLEMTLVYINPLGKLYKIFHLRCRMIGLKIPRSTPKNFVHSINGKLKTW